MPKNGKEVTGFLYDDATTLVSCPRCKAKPRQTCHGPNGRLTPTPHSERINRLHVERPDVLAAARASTARSPENFH